MDQDQKRKEIIEAEQYKIAQENLEHMEYIYSTLEDHKSDYAKKLKIYIDKVKESIQKYEAK